MSCGCGQFNCSCGQSPCSPSNSVYASSCTDPGSVNAGAYLGVYDGQLCPRRMANAAGLLVNIQTGSGWQQQWTTAPNIPLGAQQAVAGQVFGNLLVQSADGVWRYLQGPATANLYLRTLATGQFIFEALPATSVPDPLTIGTINVTTLTVAGATTLNGAVTMAGLASGTITQPIGLNASNQMVIGAAATTGVAVAMFFESATSPSAGTPNSGATVGSYLIIGNLIFDSVLPAVPGGALWTVTNSQTLTCVTAGTYVVNFEGQVGAGGSGTGKPSLGLEINGTIVSNGNTRPTTVTNGQGQVAMSSTYARRFAAGDVLKLQLQGIAVSAQTFEVRVTLTRTGD